MGASRNSARRPRLRWCADPPVIAALLSLDGLGSLQTVGHALVIYDHAALADVDALDGLESVGGAFYVVDNLSLLTSDANDLADGSPTVGGSVRISGNL